MNFEISSARDGDLPSVRNRKRDMKRDYSHIKACVLGSIMQDIVLMMQRLPKQGESYNGKDYFYANGGKGANQAVALSRLGAQVNLIGMVGEDDTGLRLKRSLRENGVGDGGVFSCKEPTGLAAILLDEADNRILVYPAANNALTAEQVEQALDLYGKAQVYCLQLETPDETIVRFIEKTKEIAPVVLDAGPSRPFALESMRGVEILSPNRTEAETLLGQRIDGEEDLLAAMKLLQRRSGAKYVVLKLGGEGSALLTEKGTVERFPAYRVKVVDTTAAGDCFTAALALEYAQSFDIRRAISFGTIAGALAVTKKGAQPSIPYLSEIIGFEKEHE